MTTTTSVRVKPEDYPDTSSSDEHMDYLRNGLRQATQWPEPLHRLVHGHDAMHGDHPAGMDWEAFCDEVADELAPKVDELLEAVIRARLPWTWKEER